MLLLRKNINSTGLGFVTVKQQTSPKSNRKNLLSFTSKV